MEAKRITDRNFFTKSATELAPWLLGKIIYRKISELETLRFRITETEAYPHDDTACHANKYKTGNAVITQNMIGGILYVHYNNTKNKTYPGSSFDIVSNKENVGEGVLIRGGVNIDNPSEWYVSAPRKLGEALKINYSDLNQIDLLDPKQTQIWIADDGFILRNEPKPQKRIGLDNAKDICDKDKNRLLRFSLGIDELK